MNERIEQLAEQCWIHTNEPLFGAKSPHWEFDRHKFAELLIQDCARVMDELNEAYGAPSTAGEFIKRYYEIDV